MSDVDIRQSKECADENKIYKKNLKCHKTRMECGTDAGNHLKTIPATMVRMCAAKTAMREKFGSPSFIVPHSGSGAFKLTKLFR